MLEVSSRTVAGGVATSAVSFQKQSFGGGMTTGLFLRRFVVRRDAVLVSDDEPWDDEFRTG